jgi:hypothetical protein
MDRHDHDGPDRPGDDDSAAASGSQPDLDARQQRFRRRVRSLEAAAVAGVLYAVLAIAGLLLLSQYPSLDQSDEEITKWFDDSANQSSLILGLNLVAVSSIAFLWFVAVIRRRVGDLEDRFFGTVFLGSGIAYVAIWLVAGAALAGPAVATNVLDSGSVSEASASLAAGFGAGLLLVVAPRVQAVFVLTTATVILRSRILPRWLAIVGYVAAVAMFLFPLVADPVGLVFPIWVAAVSIVIFVDRPASTSSPLASDQS